MGWTHYLMAAAILTVCLLLIIIILLQKGRGGGLSAAFGGGGSGSAFGAKTGDVFTWITVTFAALYLLLNVVGNFVFRQEVVAAPPSLTAPAAATPAPADTTAADQTGQPLTGEDEVQSPSPAEGDE